MGLAESCSAVIFVNVKHDYYLLMNINQLKCKIDIITANCDGMVYCKHRSITVVNYYY